MKKFLSLALAFAMSVTLLAGCAGKPAQTAQVDLEAYYQTIFTDPENSPAMMALDAEMLEGLYPGLTALELKQTVAYMPMITAVACEIVMVECAKAADVDTVKELFQARIDMGASSSNYPESAAGWKQFAQVQKSGNFVCMIVLPEGNVIPENVFAQ